MPSLPKVWAFRFLAITGPLHRARLALVVRAVTAARTYDRIKIQER